MGKLPPFTDDGLLPAGDFVLTLDELFRSSLVTGWPDADAWDTAWRRRLVENLSIMADHLWRVGVREIFIDGSFVEDKPHPNDIDGYFVCDAAALYSGALEASLQELDSIWTWDPASR